ncbi:glycine betaine ABC transporter substrate-binding protein [Streptomyces massasporeus]|uniref:caspase, EACC1-associated type n=1 Tax=Streptomyces massasporeus TaxID=67324 RepID=UPI00381290FC
MALLPDARNSRAVLIGTSRYKHLSALPAVANNLTALDTALRAPSSWGLAEEHCTVIANPGDWTEALHAVRTAAEEASDTLLVYFAGHGLLEEARGDLFLGLPHSEQGRSYTGVPYSALRDVLLTGTPQRHVVILDCCFSGRALGTMGGAGLIADQAEIEGSYLLAASSETSFALAPEGETYTAFTGELLRLLHEGVPDGPELLDLDTVYTTLRASLRAKGRPLPQKRDRNTAGLLALSRNAAWGEPDADGDHIAVDEVRATVPAPAVTPEIDRRQSAPEEPAQEAGPAAPAEGAPPRGIRKKRYLVGLLALALTMGTVCLSGSPAPLITLGYVDRDEGEAVAHLWQELLAKRGYRTKLRKQASSDLQGYHQTQGGVDVQINARLPATDESDAARWKRYRSELENLGAWYDETAISIAVPSHVEGVTSISDLKGKSILDRWGFFSLEQDSDKVSDYWNTLQKKYGLGDYQAFSEDRSLDFPTEGSEVKASYGLGFPFAVLVRSPHWAFSEYKLHKLDDPKDVLASSREDILMLGRQGFTRDEPRVAEWMKGFRLNEEQLSSLEEAVHDAGQDHVQEGVRTWLDDNPGMADKLTPDIDPKDA